MMFDSESRDRLLEAYANEVISEIFISCMCCYIQCT